MLNSRLQVKGSRPASSKSSSAGNGIDTESLNISSTGSLSSVSGKTDCEGKDLRYKGNRQWNT